MPVGADRDLAGERSRPLPPRRRPASRSTRSQLHRRGPLPDRRRGPLPIRHGEAGRLSLAQPSERVAACAHPPLDLRPRLHEPARNADVLSRRSTLRVRPDLPVGARRQGPRAPDLRVRARDHRTGVGPRLPTSTSPSAGRARRRWSRGDDSLADRRAVLLDRAARAQRERDLARRDRGHRARARRSGRARAGCDGRDLAGRRGRALPARLRLGPLGVR